MSDADSFIHEVTEEVRRDRMFRLWKRYGPFAIGAVVAAVAATAALQWLDHRDEEAARRAGAALIAAARSPDATQRAEAYAAAVDALPAGPALAAEFGAAAALAESGAFAEAAARYAAIAEAPAAPLPLAQFAAFRAAVLNAEALGPEATAAALTPLTGPDSAFRLLALEARGAALLAVGDHAGARADFDAVAADPAATEAMRERVRALWGLLGGLQ